MTASESVGDSSPAVSLLGLIGHPVAHSRSPAMQQAALDALGISARYVLWDTAPEALPTRVAALRAPGMLGANVTIPYKAAVVPLLDAITPEARRSAGVVNTIVREETGEGVRLVGHNTDVVALVRILDEAARWPEGVGARRVLVLGAGGAAQAALGAARQRGAEVWVAARRAEAALEALQALWDRELAAEQEHAAQAGTSADISRASQQTVDATREGLQPDPDPYTGTSVPRASARPLALPPDWRQRALPLDDCDWLAAALARTDVLIQATPVGTRDPAASPVPLSLLAHLEAHALVFDMVYNPPETALLRAARARGLRALGGLPMLLYQGAAAFTLWTGREAPLGLMRAALNL